MSIFPLLPTFQRRIGWILGTVLAGVLLGPPLLSAQAPQDQAAEMVLNSARRAYNDKNYPFAVARFKEFLGRYGNHKEAPAARYGLALALLEGPDKDYAAAAEQLQQVAGRQEMPEHAQVLYYLGLAQRGLGIRELAQANAKPQEAAPHRAAAHQRFEEAARQFAAALAAFTEKSKGTDPKVKDLPPDLEWAARARCDLADMQIRTLKIKEAQETAAPFLQDPLLTRSRSRNLGLYYHGFAAFLAHDYLVAGRSLNMLAPFADPLFGTHARFLLGRIHHLAEERAEAAEQYTAVRTDYEKNKKDAAETLRHPERFKNDPNEKARLEALVRDPVPDHVARAAFFLGVLLYEDGRFADALARFNDFVQQDPHSPLVEEARLRQGFCQVQLRQWGEAIKILQPLADKDPRLSDQALFYIAQAQAGAADPNNPAAFEQSVKTALDTFRRAADKAEQAAKTDPEARRRRADILLEMADQQQLVKQYKEAAALYGQLLNDKVLPQREEELLLRQITALHLAGDYNGSDQVCARFQQAHPKSPLLAPVLFRQAENAYFRALAAERNANLPNRPMELSRLNEEVIQRYQVVVDRFPEFPQVNLARYGLAMGYYRKGDLAKTREILETIPDPDRTGELALVNYVLADCLLRSAPAKAEDALTAGRLEEELKAATELLDGFVNAQPKDPQTPDALLKLGLCYQRRAVMLAQPQERAQMLGNARTTYEKIMQQFPSHPLQPQAVFERAKCQALAGDVGGAMNELRRFQNDPLKAAPVAPLALLELATLLRGQNKAADAAATLAQCRQQYEATLLKDPARAGWVPLLQYHQAVALQEAGKLAEARALFDQLARQGTDHPEGADALLRAGQCLKEEGLQKLAAARKTLADANLKPEARTAASKTLEEGSQAVRQAAQSLESQADKLKDQPQNSDLRARMLYEAAWCYRALAELEIASAREQLQKEQWQKLKDEAAKNTPPGQTPPSVAPPEVAQAAVPEQPSTKKAHALYEALIEDFGDTALATDARFELAELLAGQGQWEQVEKQLSEALDKEPAAELTDKVRLRLGESHAAKGDFAAALTEFEAVAQNPKSPLAGQAQYRAGECLFRAKDYEKAVAHLAVFRDQQPFQNLPGVTDRALLRLGEALAHLGRWDQSRQALEQLVNRFGSSPWVPEARYGMGWAWQNQKQYDNAVNAYNQVAAGTETGAKAQLQIGLCRLEQKRYAEAAVALMAVPYTYDYPELNAAALCEAGRALVELKQPDQAVSLWRRVLQDHPQSEWAKVAKERLNKVTK